MKIFFINKKLKNLNLFFEKDKNKKKKKKSFNTKSNIKIK